MDKILCERCFDEYNEGEIYPSAYFCKILYMPCEREYERKLQEFRIKFMNNVEQIILYS